MREQKEGGGLEGQVGLDPLIRTKRISLLTNSGNSCC